MKEVEEGTGPTERDLARDVWISDSGGIVVLLDSGPDVEAYIYPVIHE